MKINCDISNCSHNNSGVCYSDRVNMAGSGAVAAVDTCCGSFLNRNLYSTLTNNVNGGSSCDCLVCKVDNCKYNDNTICQLDSINVGSSSEVQIYSETNCNSFSEE